MVADIIRIRNYRHYGSEGGRAWIEIKHADKTRVFVAVIVGDEPLEITSPEAEECHVDDMIVEMAKYILKHRKAERARKIPPKGA